MSTVTAPASADEAMDMVQAGLAYLAAADVAAMGTAHQAACLRGLEQANSVVVAARTSILGTFAAGQGYADDGDFSPCTWLMHQTAITRGAASGHTGWVRRGKAHPRVLAALAAEEISESWAGAICEWTGKLPEDSRDAADGILLAAAVSGLGLADLAGLAGEMYERSCQHQPESDGPGPGPGQDPGPEHDKHQEHDKRQDRDPGEDKHPAEGEVFDDRSVRLVTTFGGAGVIRGDLTPECAQVVQAVLDSLSARAGAEDDRSHEQRYLRVPVSRQRPPDDHVRHELVSNEHVR